MLHIEYSVTLMRKGDQIVDYIHILSMYLNIYIFICISLDDSKSKLFGAGSRFLLNYYMLTVPTNTLNKILLE